MEDINKYIRFLKKNNYSKNTIRSYKTILSNKTLDLYKITSIRKYILYSKAVSTTHTKYNVILSFLKWSGNKRWILLKQLKLPKYDQVYREIITKKELYNKTKKLELKCLIIRFLFETGIRASELETIHDVNVDTLKILGKGNKKREIFHNFETTKQILGKYNVTTKTLRLWIKEVLGEKYTPHSLRRSHATHMILNGATVKSVSMQLGHVKIETTYRYLQLSKKENLNIYKKHF
ncbi:MAG: tyrosine-type recombinase/integrase [Mycoplasma sp.]|nr:tyrosine-type recombinase/integrase [Mycoplasma sp.]